METEQDKYVDLCNEDAQIKYLEVPKKKDEETSLGGQDYRMQSISSYSSKLIIIHVYDEMQTSALTREV